MIGSSARAEVGDPLIGIGVGRRIALLAVHHVCVNGRLLAGGAEKYIQMVVRALLRSGASVHVGYSGASIYDELLEEADPSRLTVECTGWLDAELRGDRWGRLGAIAARRRWLRGTNADTVFAIQQDSGASFAVSLLAAKSLGLRVVSTIRQEPPSGITSSGDGDTQTARARAMASGNDRKIARRRSGRLATVWRRRLSAACCDAVIFNSRRVCDAYAKEYGFDRSRSRVLYNGVPCADSPVMPAQTGKLTMATAGRITEAKGADDVFAVFSALATRYPHLRLVYFGEGPLEGRLRERAAALGLAHRVEFAGYRTNRDEMFRGVDLYLQLSRRESMSNSVMEAMARGIPCIVSDSGGLPEMIEHGVSGCIVATGDIEGYVSAADRLLQSPESRRRHGLAARERASLLFDMHRFELNSVQTILGC